MGKFLEALIVKLEDQITAENEERHKEGLPHLPHLEITLLGQVALMTQDMRGIPLAATADFDAWICPKWEGKRIIHDTLKSFGLHYDELSREIWMPEDSVRITIYESPLLLIETFRVVDILVSKAVKALEKNKFLLRHALSVFGEELEQRLKLHGVKSEEFLR